MTCSCSGWTLLTCYLAYWKSMIWLALGYQKKDCRPLDLQFSWLRALCVIAYARVRAPLGTYIILLLVINYKKEKEKKKTDCRPRIHNSSQLCVLFNIDDKRESIFNCVVEIYCSYFSYSFITEIYIYNILFCCRCLSCKSSQKRRIHSSKN